METGLVLPWALNRRRTSLTISTLLLIVPSTSITPLPGPSTVIELSRRPVVPPDLSCRSCRRMIGSRSKMLWCEPAPVNSNSQVTTNEWELLFRLAESTRAAWVLPGLVIEETGSGEMSGTKYMKEAKGFPGDWSRPKSNRRVGPATASMGRTTAGGPDWLSPGSRPFAQSTSASSILAPPHPAIDAARDGEPWCLVSLIIAACCSSGRNLSGVKFCRFLTGIELRDPLTYLDRKPSC